MSADLGRLLMNHESMIEEIKRLLYLLQESLHSLWVSVNHLHLIILCLLGVPMLEHFQKDVGSCTKNLFVHGIFLFLTYYFEICKIFSAPPEVVQVSC